MSNNKKHHRVRIATTALGDELLKQRMNGAVDWLKFRREVVLVIHEFGVVFDRREYDAALSKTIRRKNCSIEILPRLGDLCRDLTATPRGEAALSRFEASRGYRPITLCWDTRSGAVLRIGEGSISLRELLG